MIEGHQTPQKNIRKQYTRDVKQTTEKNLKEADNPGNEVLKIIKYLQRDKSRNCVQEEDAFTKVRSQSEFLGINKISMLTKMKQQICWKLKLEQSFRLWKWDKDKEMESRREEAGSTSVLEVQEQIIGVPDRKDG